MDDLMDDECYLFNSCLRPYLLVLDPICEVKAKFLTVIRVL